MRLGFTGDPNAGYGITGYRNYQLVQFNTGHLVSGVIQNAPNPPWPPQNLFYADYYITGINNSPFSKPAEGIAAARATTSYNLNYLPAYIADNSLSYGSIRFHFGQTGRAPNLQNSWNLGADDLGVEWTGNLTSPIENRIYTANTALVETSLYYNDTKIIVFGYSPLYEIINYGGTEDPADDIIQAYSNKVTAQIVDGLGGHALGVAQAFMQDVVSGGGYVQLYFNTVQAATYTGLPETYSGTQYIVANYSFEGSS